MPSRRILHTQPTPYPEDDHSDHIVSEMTTDYDLPVSSAFDSSADDDR